MPNLIVSTCGTSLLTNLAGTHRGLVIRHANARSIQDVAPPDRETLLGLIQRMSHELKQADTARCAELSAELNGLICLFGNTLDGGRDTHWLIATDTWMGLETANAIATVLQRFGCNTDVKQITDLRTGNLAEFRAAIPELVNLCAREIRGMREGGFRVTFNLTGGFKSVQGLMQSLGMLYADESVYVFEGSRELLRLPRLPITLSTIEWLRQYHRVFRRLDAGLQVLAAETAGVPDTLLMEIDGEVALSVWGEVVWAEASKQVMSEQIWPSLDEKITFSQKFSDSTRKAGHEEIFLINQRIGDLARHHHNSSYNPGRLDFKKLQIPHKGSTHECDAWAHGAAKRLYGHYEKGVFVLDSLDDALH